MYHFRPGARVSGARGSVAKRSVAHTSRPMLGMDGTASWSSDILEVVSWSVECAVASMAAHFSRRYSSVLLVALTYPTTK